MHRFAHKMTYAAAVPAAVLLLAGCGRSTSPGNMGPTGSTVSSSSLGGSATSSQRTAAGTR
jgi:hypothetical protein